MEMAYLREHSGRDPNLEAPSHASRHRRLWVGGYELGISFPPDWVGEFVFAAEDEAPEGVFRSGMVTNCESIFRPGLIDTIVYEKEGARRLSKTRPTLTVIG